MTHQLPLAALAGGRPSRPSTDGLPVPECYGSLSTIWLAMGMAVLDGVVMNLVLPVITRGLHVDATSAVWVINALPDRHYHAAAASCSGRGDRRLPQGLSFWRRPVRLSVAGLRPGARPHGFGRLALHSGRGGRRLDGDERRSSAPHLPVTGPRSRHEV